MKRTIILLFAGLSASCYGQNEVIDEFNDGIVNTLMYQSIDATLIESANGMEVYSTYWSRRRC